MFKLTVLLFFITSITHGQTSCDTLSPNLTLKYNAYSSKKINRIKNSRNLTNKVAYELATYFRQKNDTTYKEWYLLYIDLTKKMYEKKYCDKDSPPDPLFYVGVAYYCTGNYEQAYAWFTKAIKANYSNKCLDYYFAQTKTKLGKN